jgi:hypothetical protein
MAFSLYQASVPVYVKLLTALSGMLDKTAAHAAGNKIEPAAFLDARLFPDMWPLKMQVQAATNHAFRGIARLAGVAIPTITDAAGSFADLKTRINETLTFIEGIDRAALDAGATREITFPIGEDKRTMTGEQYFLTFSLPNFYFHLTACYSILRHNGVALSKLDFLGPI